jgi:DNA-binding transcriptional MerR regulator
MGGVPDHLSIGDFSRATHMTVKTLRHYHQIGLLEPAEVDPSTGYRRYATDQIPAAQVIRRFRGLGMPLEEIQAVLSAPDLRIRNQRITAHLRRLEQELGRVQSATASLRDLLAASTPTRCSPGAAGRRPTSIVPTASWPRMWPATPSR